MGSSASAYLFFGRPLEAEANPFYVYNDDYEPVTHDGRSLTDEEVDSFDDLDLGEYLARQAGLENPFDRPEVRDLTSSEYEEFKTTLEGKGFDALVDDYYEKKRALEKAAPITFEYSGNLTYGVYQYVLALQGDYTRSSYWGSELIDLPDAPTQEEIDTAVEFCKSNNLPSFEGAGWVLAANYG